jgi:ABC-2 type transport system ATP-binding protein
MGYAIETKELTKYYGKARGIIDVDLAMEEGEIFGFIGPNGAGKSTTIRTLLGLIKKTSGSASVFGMDCEKDKVKILSQVGYLPGEVFYYDNMRAIDLLRYSASFYKKDCSKRIAELADALSLDLNKKIEDMSLGNKKKVGIVQGLLHSPKLIILDEPTSGLDPLMQRTFFDLIQRENERGASVLFSSHILGEVQRICDRVAIIKEGRIVDLRSIDEMRKNSYKKVSITSREPLSGFELPGMAKLSQDGAQTSFLYNGDVSLLLKKLSALPLVDANVSEPELEEIFLHYYEDGEAKT